MPLVGGDLCPIAIDVVETFTIVDPAEQQEKVEKEEEPSTLFKYGEYQDTDHPIIEKSEHHIGDQQDPSLTDPTDA